MSLLSKKRALRCFVFAVVVALKIVWPLFAAAVLLKPSVALKLMKFAAKNERKMARVGLSLSRSLALSVIKYKYYSLPYTFCVTSPFFLPIYINFSLFLP
ncbi:hypothetical protein BDB00DRAFT_818139 [Zychaea mexicana]|uniref:uncharacterized protein n=1 Tax=Zychaea mexicana TaxID=64656 RepID=UPI0022FF21E5|nr:uncharacterized protein BDB00DRAFT_818139 [Zychaea mexicana]KAI9494460.1 hypothetical protein BDB00DRAFT_818139 [Zychaea mexicana]